MYYDEAAEWRARVAGVITGIIIVIIALISFIILITPPKVDTIKAYSTDGEDLGYDRFQVLDGSYNSQALIVDTTTGVEYVYINGGLSILLEHDGTPVIAEGYYD